MLEVSSPIAQDASAILALVTRYADVPMSLADACLVQLVETAVADRVVTFDSDFRVYRLSKRREVPTLMP
jgi:predicted nucleic acid-binding protein